MIRRISYFALLAVALLLLAACAPIQPMEGTGAAAGEMATAMPTEEAMGEATAMPMEEATEEAMGEATAMPAEEATEEAMGEATAMPAEEATAMPMEEATAMPAEEGAGAMTGATVMVGDGGDLGPIVVAADGMTLYMFDRDEPPISNCYDDCATKWPPLLVNEGEQPVAGEGVTGTLGVTERTDGTYQVTLNDWPLYYWWEDVQPGDTLGQAVGDVWWVMAPDGTIIR